MSPGFHGEVTVKSWCFLLLEHILEIPNLLHTLLWGDLCEAGGSLFPWLQPSLCLSSVYRKGDSDIEINIKQKPVDRGRHETFPCLPQILLKNETCVWKPGIYKWRYHMTECHMVFPLLSSPPHSWESFPPMINCFFF